MVKRREIQTDVRWRDGSKWADTAQDDVGDMWAAFGPSCPRQICKQIEESVPFTRRRRRDEQQPHLAHHVRGGSFCNDADAVVSLSLITDR